MNLLSVEKPTRYMGGELGSIVKNSADLRIAFAFPDVYEVGMSHLGLRILYHIINSIDNFAAERVYAPWSDMEESIRKDGSTLFTLETSTALNKCDIVAFTLPYELSYSNIANMLNLGKISLFAIDRGEDEPIVIAGGPCAYNPEPVADFFDAILIGDGEEAIVEIANTIFIGRRDKVSRKEIISNLSKIDGVYLPSLFEPQYLEDGKISKIAPLGSKDKVVRRFLSNLDSALFPQEPVVPFMKTVHDRVAIEVARGCTRGCRFCQAGFIYRPLRERSPEKILQIAENALQATGYEELSLLSLSTGDYSCIEPLLKELMHRYADNRISVSLPSLRVGTLTEELIEEIKKVRKTGFTLAPEAGSERMRRIINKGIAEDDLIETAYNVFKAGWRSIKLYFMIGLPNEEDDDIMQIVHLSKRVKDEGRRAGGGGDVNVSVSNFVPKAHTPFQWERQLSIAEVKERQKILDAELKKRKLRLKWHDAPLSFLEGVFARGNRKLAKVIARAVELGCRFDGWREHFDFAKWMQAFKDCGIDPEFYLRKRQFDEILPWDHIDCGVTKDFFIKEKLKSVEEASTIDCRFGDCTACGVCDFKEIKTVRYADSEIVPKKDAISGNIEPKRVQIRFSKKGKMIYLSHLDLITLFTRAVSKAKVKVIFTQGFHPHPRFSFATATSVGVESEAEYMDIYVTKDTEPLHLQKEMNAALPEGIKILEAKEIPLKSPSLSTIIEETIYEISSEKWNSEDIKRNCSEFVDRDSYILKRNKKGEEQIIDLRKESTSLRNDDAKIILRAKRGKPIEFARAIMKDDSLDQNSVTIKKLEVIFSEQYLP